MLLIRFISIWVDYYLFLLDFGIMPKNLPMLRYTTAFRQSMNKPGLIKGFLL